jgi:hypothetical protein
MLPPIKLTLYDANDEEIATYERHRIPWGILKKAVALQTKVMEAEKKEEARQWWQIWKKNEKTSVEEAQLYAISQFVVELFGNQFTVKQLEEGADTPEVLAVFRAVLSRANQSVNSSGFVNPQKPSTR